MMNYLKRRFSSGDLQGGQDEEEHENKLISTITKRIENTSLNMNFVNNINSDNKNNSSNASANSNNTTNNNNNISNIISNFTNVNRRSSTSKGPSPSAPASPTKNTSFADSVLNAARVMINNNSPNSSQHQTTTNNYCAPTGSKVFSNRDKIKILLVIDDDHTDWSKYFRNRRLNGEFEIRVEQVI